MKDLPKYKTCYARGRLLPLAFPPYYASAVAVRHLHCGWGPEMRQHSGLSPHKCIWEQLAARRIIRSLSTSQWPMCRPRTRAGGAHQRSARCSPRAAQPVPRQELSQPCGRAPTARRLLPGGMVRTHSSAQRQRYAALWRLRAAVPAVGRPPAPCAGARLRADCALCCPEAGRSRGGPGSRTGVGVGRASRWAAWPASGAWAGRLRSSRSLGHSVPPSAASTLSRLDRAG